jgi:hypothetical protein
VIRRELCVWGGRELTNGIPSAALAAAANTDPGTLSDAVPHNAEEISSLGGARRPHPDGPMAVNEIEFFAAAFRCLDQGLPVGMSRSPPRTFEVV